MAPKRKLDWTNITFLATTPFLAAITVALHVRYEGLSWLSFALFAAFYLLSGLSITAGYHRLFSHRAFAAHPVVRLAFLFFGAGAFQNSALKWCSDHRLHHRHVDTPQDPYSIQNGFFFAHVGWILYRAHPAVVRSPAKDLASDRLVLWQDRYYLPLAVLSGLVLPTIVGWACGVPIGGLAMGGLLRLVAAHHSTFLVNSASHMFGSQPYSDCNSARDNWFTAFLTCGEGYHNFHHAFPGDHRNGVLWYQFDPTKWFIAGLRRIGLVSRVRSTSAEIILRARLMMESRRMRNA